MKPEKTLATALLACILMIPLAACQKQGPMEDAGEKIDEAVEDAGDAVEDATDGN